MGDETPARSAESGEATRFATKHPNCCPRCGWHNSSHGDSGYGPDCPAGISPANRAGELPEQLAARSAESAPSGHDCNACTDCIHDGNRCCGCYDGACCQIPAESAPQDGTRADEVEALLDAHVYRVRLLDCSCGEWRASGLSELRARWDKQHRAHVASILAAAGFASPAQVEAARHEAWAEGYRAGFDEDMTYMETATNPYERGQS